MHDTEAEAETAWGLVSDVHGNFEALEYALRILSAAGARRLAFLGDYLGRGDSDRCVRRIRDVAALAVVGNRDFDWQHRVSPETRGWILGLPRTACVGPLVVAHGDARLTPALSTSQIARDFQRTWQAMASAQASMFAFGHSHQARVWRKASPGQPAELLEGRVVSIEPEYRYFVNVGTTGLPFPGKGGPSVSVVDFARAQILHLAVDPNRIGSE